ncbi:carcinoembryonic antigen-related cell adhesion molecule 1 isoform X2 [Siniperca chuatsi]|uniref:carcinoembryonic antigen-related cell adhesion molecule 1 isoform X2 n=1 Tax=Siniperca chuatsi TaxID=119488 RepID=UPI001CE05BD7|nr:carcinoembryonic antigen-related cell adhesion molecule 1 isoform X2 [Siniperca chuatsi]XP_044064749.1 carcinoembryonic antigen-related cell adhesion molecule 1 isoform X2 [Siniperca chuatsi]
MQSPVVFVLILATITFATAPAYSQMIYASENPLPVGSNVTLFSQSTVTAAVWMFNNDIIVMIFPGDKIISNTWRDRITFNSTTSSLTIKSLQVEDSGLYTLNAMNSVPAQLTLSVRVPISNVTVRANATNLVEFIDTAVLMCSVAHGTYPSYVWLNGSSVVTASEGVQLSNGNATLTIVRVTHYDDGLFRCNVSNGISHEISLPVYLNISYGPMKPVITGPSMALTGTWEIFNCSSASHPPSHIIWYFNNSQVATTSELAIGPLTLNMSGKYICMAFNSVTGKNSTAYTMLTVLAPVTMVSIKTVEAQPLLNHTFTLIYGPETPTIMGPNVAKTGDNVTLSCYASSNPLSFYKWFFNDSLVANTSEYVTPPLTIAMSGMYTCMAYNNITGKNSTAYKMLTVVDPIIDVQVETSITPAIEGDFYMLKCNVTGPAEHVYWMKNGEPLHADNRTAFKTDEKTVDFNPLERSDTGYYQCMAINAVCNMTSLPYKLLVNYGPETPIINGSAFAETGHSTTFQCSAMSMPPSQFSWWFNDSLVANTSVFTTGHLSFNMSGEYTCKAYNNVTGKNSTNSKMLTVIEAIESVMVRNNTVPISSKNFTLTCVVTGPYDRIHWMKNSMHLNMNTSTANTHMSYHTENNMLHFTPVTMYNDGSYQCVATNQACPHDSPQYNLRVNYGPLSVNISGPDSAKVGSSVSLTCSADSWPGCDFSWFLNNQSSGFIKTGSVITFSARKGTEGNYTCKARNPVTNITAVQTKSFTVTAHASTLHMPSQGGLMLMGLFALSGNVLFN